MALVPDSLLGERYRLISLIATGGMGQVWRAEDTTLHRVVAVKVLRSEFTGDSTFLARFRAEARNTALLSHPNIASIYDYGEAGSNGEGLAYLVMELVDGEPLSDLLARGRLSAPDTLRILGMAAAGLDAAHHAGVVHRDIKPGNLLVRPDGTVKITDFGIARAADNVPLTQTGMVVGTAHYLSPEQAEGRVTTPASDVYSLGVVGYECLAGRRPFEGDNSVAVALMQIRERPGPLPADVPSPVRELIDRSLAKDPSLRFPTGGEFASAIATVQAGRALPPAPVAGPATSSGVATQVIAAGAAGAGLAAAAGAGPGMAGQRGPGTRAMATPPMGAPPVGAPPRHRPLAPEPRRSGSGPWPWLILALLLLAGLIGLLVAMNLNTDPGTDEDPAPGPGTQQTTDVEETSPPPTTTAATTEAEETTQPEETTATQTTAPTDEEPDTVDVNADDFVGRSFPDVQRELRQLGLVVEGEEEETDEFERGTVLELDPTGEVEVGETITVIVAVPEGNGNGNGNDDDN